LQELTATNQSDILQVKQGLLEGQQKTEELEKALQQSTAQAAELHARETFRLEKLI